MRQPAAGEKTPLKTPMETPARRAIGYREAFLETVTPEDVRAISTALLERAKSGDAVAARLVLDRVLGTLSVDRWDSRASVEKHAWLEEFAQ